MIIDRVETGENDKLMLCHGDVVLETTSVNSMD